MISMIRSSGGSPEAAKAPRTSSSKESASNWRPEALTDILVTCPACRHAMAWRQASWRTQRPTGMIKPDASRAGMNSSGCEQATGGVVPAQEGFYADDGHVGELEDRLVQQEELVGADGRLQVHLELVSAAQLGLHFGLEDDVAVLARLLGGVEGDVGVAQQVLGTLAQPDGDADAGRDADRRLLGVVVEMERFGQDVQEALGHQFGPGGQGDALGHHDELVAAQAGDRVGFSKRAGEAGRHGLSSLSPMAWPKVSLTSLKPSRSMNRAATSKCSRRARARVWFTRSKTRTRLGSPVRLSCRAWWRISSSRRALRTAMAA